MAKLLIAFAMAVCQSDSPDFRLWDVVITGFVYVRLHGHTREYVSSYSPRSLEEWARRLTQWRSEDRDAYLSFNNTVEGPALRDTQKLKELVDTD